MTRAQLRAKVLINTGRDNTNAVTATNDGLGFGLKELSKIHAFDVLRPQVDIAFVANDIGVQLPSGLKQIFDLRLVDPANPSTSYPIVLLRKTEFTNMFPNVVGSTITGSPSYAYRDDNKLYFDKISNASYTLRVTYYHLDSFDSDFDEPTIKDCEECLIDYATAYVYKSIQMYDDANFWMNEFSKHVGTLVREVERQTGNNLVARPWTNDLRRVGTNAPWLDPFSGVSR